MVQPEVLTRGNIREGRSECVVTLSALPLSGLFLKRVSANEGRPASRALVAELLLLSLQLQQPEVGLRERGMVTETMSPDFPSEDVAATSPKPRLPLPQPAPVGFFLGVLRLRDSNTAERHFRRCCDSVRARFVLTFDEAGGSATAAASSIPPTLDCFTVCSEIHN